MVTRCLIGLEGNKSLFGNGETYKSKLGGYIVFVCGDPLTGEKRFFMVDKINQFGLFTGDAITLDDLTPCDVEIGAN